MNKTLYIIRGLPGSGKSTLANIMSIGLDIEYYEADMYFIDELGNYNFDPKNIGNAHIWCQNQVKTQLEAGKSVIVSNTFVKRWEMKPYLDMADEFNTSVNIIECKSQFGSIHGVPEETVERMAKNWEEITRIEELNRNKEEA